MKKFLTLLSAAALTVTAFATVASAAITENVYNPEWVIEVVDVDDEGYAQIDVSIELDTELAYTASKGKYLGTALSMTDLLLTFNEDMFTEISYEGATMGGFGSMTEKDGVYNIKHLWNNEAAQTKVGKSIYHGVVWGLLSESYVTKTAEELNAMDFATVVKAGLQIADWPTKLEEAKADITSFYSDGTATFGCDYRVGAEAVEPPYEPTWEPASEEWTADNEGKQAIWWPKDYAAGDFPGFVTVKVTDGTTTKTVGVGAAKGFDIEGAVSFAVAVILDADVDATYFDCVVE